VTWPKIEDSRTNSRRSADKERHDRYSGPLRQMRKIHAGQRHLSARMGCPASSLLPFAYVCGNMPSVRLRTQSIPPRCIPAPDARRLALSLALPKRGQWPAVHSAGPTQTVRWLVPTVTSRRSPPLIPFRDRWRNRLRAITARLGARNPSR
jgi:hypothetical protein